MSSSETEDLYRSAIDTFNRLRNKYERHESKDIGGRSFILVSAMDAEMKSPYEADTTLLWALLRTSYDRHGSRIPQHKPHELYDFLPVFYTLLDLECGHLVDLFLEHRPPLRLPIEKHVLERMFHPTGVDRLTGRCFGQLSEDFYKQQWQWCALEFNGRMGSKIEHPEYIIPITARSKIQPTRDVVPKVDRKTNLWVVEIPMECLTEELKQELGETGSEDEPDTAGGANKVHSAFASPNPF